jgi:hypothetical protein
MTSKSNPGALAVLISVFFFWGFVAASNDILIPVFKEKLNLEQWQSQMISFAFYVAYTIGSLIYFFVSRASGGDILNKIGYKNGIALGLVISALGTLLFYPAAQSSSFGLMISGLFIVGLGFSLAANCCQPACHYHWQSEKRRSAPEPGRGNKQYRNHNWARHREPGYFRIACCRPKTGNARISKNTVPGTGGCILSSGSYLQVLFSSQPHRA